MPRRWCASPCFRDTPSPDIFWYIAYSRTPPARWYAAMLDSRLFFSLFMLPFTAFRISDSISRRRPTPSPVYATVTSYVRARYRRFTAVFLFAYLPWAIRLLCARRDDITFIHAPCLRWAPDTARYAWRAYAVIHDMLACFVLLSFCLFSFILYTLLLMTMPRTIFTMVVKRKRWWVRRLFEWHERCPFFFFLSRVLW